MATCGVIELSADEEGERRELEGVEVFIGGKQMGRVACPKTIDELG